MEESEMSEGKYTVKDSCVVSPLGDHAPTCGHEIAKKACEQLNRGRRHEDFLWDSGDCGCHRHKPDPDAIVITHDHVFRDRDWGLGMFDADNPHVVVDEDRIWLMIGTDPVEFGKTDPFLDAISARSIASMLVAAADYVEGKE
jgi:hypothetical protein